jgi:hypothetical protein
MKATSKPDQETCLLPAMGLGDYLQFVRERVVNGAAMDPSTLADTWRKAAKHFDVIQTAQAGAPDKPPVLPLPKAMQAHVQKLTGMKSFQDTFNTVPVAFGMVELGTLVAYQQCVAASNIDYLRSSLPDPATAAQLIKICLPLTPPDSAFKLARREGDQFVFISDHHDARFLGPQLLDPAQIQDFSVTGHAKAVLALPFGFTTNVLNVVRFGSRMVLNNGYHRALALLARGITHAPCIIQVCAHWDDVALAGARTIYNQGETYFSHPRPTMLKDFLDKKLTQKFATYPLRKELRVSFEVNTLKLSV